MTRSCQPRGIRDSRIWELAFAFLIVINPSRHACFRDESLA